MRSVRWARLNEIDRRVSPGTKAFYRQPQNHQELIAWRGMHAVAKHGHSSVRMFGTQAKCRPSSNLPLEKKINFYKRFNKLKIVT